VTTTGVVVADVVTALAVVVAEEVVADDVVLLDAFRHWEYQSFEYWQVQPAWQVVGPVQLLPPHCP